MRSLFVALVLFGCGAADTEGDPLASGTAVPKREGDTSTGSVTATPPAAPSASTGTTTPATVECAAQAVSWTVAGQTCTVDAPVIALGATLAVTDSTLDATGTATLVCMAGHIVTTKTICELPRTIALGSDGCGGGYCSAAIGGQCGQPDAAKAKAICVAKGFGDKTTFTTSAGPVGVAQCNPDGSGCFVNQNASCNIVFTSVTCRH